MELVFDSRNQEFKKPFGAVREGSKMHLTVYTDEEGAEAFLLLRPDGGEEQRIKMEKTGMANGYGIYSVSFAFASCGLYFYRFCLQKGDWCKFFGRGSLNRPEAESQAAWQVLCYREDKKASSGFGGNIYYQIFPDRFYRDGECDLSEKLEPYWVHQNMRDVPQYLPDEHGEIKNNDFFGGNLRGIMKKLDYLAELGVEVLYLNPIFMAYSNHRYDTADYKRIDPMLGTEQDFRELCKRAHKQGMKVILDGVFSHTGDNSVYFDKYHHFGNGAASNPESPYRSWYRFSNYPHDYDSWWGIRTLPCVEEMHPSYLEYIVTGKDSVIRHWLRAGADGYRLDVADELPDEFLEILHRTVKEEKPGAVVIGEVWEDASNKISYDVRRKYFYGAELDGVMNYVYRTAMIDFVTGTISAERFLEQVMQLAENYPKTALDCSMNLLSTHDTGRILTLLAGTDGNRMSRDERAFARLDEQQYKKGLQLLSAAVFLLFTLPGSPCIYYGDEIGMQGYEDPFNRRFFDWENMDKKVEELYRSMAAVRKASLALKNGEIIPCATGEGFVSFYRKTGDELLLCAVNISNQAVALPIPCGAVRTGTGYLSNNKKITLLPYGYGVFEVG